MAEGLVITDHEEKLIFSFVIKSKQDRCLTLLSSKKGRAKFRSSLSHFQFYLDNRYLHRIPSSNQDPTFIFNFLKAKNAPEKCLVICELIEFDKKFMTLSESFNTLFGRGIGYFISCIPGKLVYYESEDVQERYFLFK
jgi:hypothetical protein